MFMFPFSISTGLTWEVVPSKMNDFYSGFAGDSFLSLASTVETTGSAADFSGYFSSLYCSTSSISSLIFASSTLEVWMLFGSASFFSSYSFFSSLTFYKTAFILGETYGLLFLDLLLTFDFLRLIALSSYYVSFSLAVLSERTTRGSYSLYSWLV